MVYPINEQCGVDMFLLYHDYHAYKDIAVTFDSLIIYLVKELACALPAPG